MQEIMSKQTSKLTILQLTIRSIANLSHNLSNVLKLINNS